MLISGYEIDLERALRIIKRAGVRRVGVQVPDGLKRSAPEISRIIEETGAEVLVSGDPCYGACDIDLQLCSMVDLMVHIGHSEMCESLSDRIVYIEARMPDDVTDVAKRSIGFFTKSRVAVCTTIQHAHTIDSVIEIMRSHGIEAITGGPSPRTRHRGQVLGCCYAAARVGAEEALFIGTGRFHPLGLSMATGMRVIAADPLTGSVEEIDTHDFLRWRYGIIARASDAKSIGILISKKPGQRRCVTAKRLSSLGRSKGRSMLEVYIDRIEPERILDLGLDAVVSTACPRIALDDAPRYSVPVLTPPEFEIALGVRSEYIFDEILDACGEPDST
ncbi:MAG: diphthamide biosynthesis enzyme Dph2 [Methanothrix sp.]|uniref:diphthamide biosynthesis enzyme Dph2 n=1 Tax=Methanothrix sp. TaxID=90426 RepID=UPI0025FDC266|nr:diphthamide biosynthesis enzyme Dph2 [Methanothrix sp.]MCQ8902915.1 diphthamide biosynthesis enzyme Dph2 [Methanothrix sp.]